MSVLHLAAAVAAAQTPAAATSPRATTLGTGWTQIGAGRPAEAIRTADALLAKNPRDHGALTLKVEALSLGKNPQRALDAYERWLGLVRVEDLFLIEPIARGVLEQIAAGNDTELKMEALERLARAGVSTAKERLDAARTASTGTGTDAALARLGDSAAAARLTAEEAALAPGRKEVLAEALPAAGAAAIPALRRLLTDPAGPTRAAAIRGLGQLDARAALPDIRRAMTDQDPLVRARAAVALARMRESDGEDMVARMLESPVADMRLIAAEAYADRGAGAWVNAIMPLLQDMAGLTRLRAAELLAPVNPEAARGVLAAAAADNNPVVRAEATRILDAPAIAAAMPTDLPSLRRLLRDPEAGVRLHAAGIVIGLAAGGR